MLYIMASILVGWGILTLIAELKGEARVWKYNTDITAQKALIVYNPDLFYNLDEQVCKAFAEEIKDMQVTVATVAAAEKEKEQQYDLYVFCANTYNWRPDKPTAGFINNSSNLNNKPVVAITLGSGSTKASQDYLETIIRNKSARLIASRSFWLLKPNDESRTNEKNIEVAINLVHKWAKEIMDSPHLHN